jgi:DNA-binding transcriptional LysR family regulator
MSNIYRVPTRDVQHMSADIELRHLRYFIAVAEEGGFSQAARRLGMAQPPLSQQIRQLEERIGLPLFERRPRVRLTSAGERFLPSARHQLALLERAIQATRRCSAVPRGIVHAGFSSSAGLTLLPAVWRAFQTRTPEVELRLQELHSGEQLQQLRAGLLEVGILREPSVDDTFVTRELLREEFVALLPSRHRLARRAIVQVATLADEPFVLFPRTTAPALYDQIFSLCAEGGFSPTVAQQAREWHTIAGLVAAGLGVSVAPASVARLRMAGVVARPLRPSVLRAALFLCHSRESLAQPAAEFVKFVMASCHRLTSSSR